MVRWGFVVFVLFFSINLSFSQSVNMHARAAGMGRAFVTLQDGWSVFGNIGGMARVKSISALFAYENRYGFVDGFQSVAAGIIVPTPVGNASLSAYRFGDELFSQQKLSLGWAHQISRMGIGVQAHYWQHYAEGYGSRANLAIDVGGVASIIPKLTFGLHIANVNQAKLSEEERIPTLINAGLSYQPVKPFCW